MSLNFPADARLDWEGMCECAAEQMRLLEDDRFQESIRKMLFLKDRTGVPPVHKKLYIEMKLIGRRDSMATIPRL